MPRKIPSSPSRIGSQPTQAAVRPNSMTADGRSDAQASHGTSDSVLPTQASTSKPGSRSQDFRPRHLLPPTDDLRPTLQTPVRSGKNTPTRSTPGLPVTKAAHTPGKLFTDHAGSPAVGSTTPPMASTPGRVSAVKDPSNQRVNDIQTFTKGLTTYRGDNSFNSNQATEYSAQFFTLEKQVASTQYGELVLKFELQKDIKLLRLDKNAEGFHHWLQNTKQFLPSEKEILYKSFGYPKNNSETTITNGQPRPRVSKGEQDRTMLSMIQCYARETGQKIDGYYNSTMPNGALGKLTTQNGKAPLFHAELAVADGQVFGQPEIASQMTTEQVESLNMDAKRIRLEAQDRLARQSKKRQRDSW